MQCVKYSFRLFKTTERRSKGQHLNILLYNKEKIIQQYCQCWILTFGTQLLTRLVMLSSTWLSDFKGYR